MPTHDGDVVVSHSGDQMLLCAIWTVEDDHQQTPGPSAYVSSAYGPDAALKLAKMLVRERRRGDVFLFDKNALTWTQPSD